jgi:C4-dicarboxylate transporter DctM subunit
MSTLPPTRGAESRGGSRLAAVLARAGNLFSFSLLCLTALLPMIQVVSRKLSLPGIRGSGDYIQHLVLWAAFVGCAITSREDRHLALTVGYDRLGDSAKRRVRVATGAVSAFIGTILTFSSLSFAVLGFGPEMRAGVIPIRLLVLAMPVGLALVTARLVTHAARTAGGRLLAALGVVAGISWAAEPLAGFLSWAGAAPWFAAPAARAAAEGALSFAGWLAPIASTLHEPLLVVLITAALFGAPIFVLLGGLAVLFFVHGGGPLEVIPNQAYTMLSGPVIPALPLFTLAGYLISESKAGERMVRLFKGVLGWLPGGLAIVSVVICAFLTTFTGASGVTILAVGGLLAFVLAAGQYRERFATGLLTASGSVGLLFPPSLPVILYGVVAQVSIKDMFVGGILPGTFMVLALAAMGVFRALRDRVPRIPFRAKEAVLGLRDSILEVALPILILVLFLNGVMTLVETAAFAVVYSLVVEVLIYRDIPLSRLPEVFLKSTLVMGGVLIILAVANGLSYYLVDAEIPGQLAGWLQAYVRSRYMFLLLLNVALLVVGAFMDIYSAITVVVPLIIPMAAAYGIHPVHLGIIFLANLELGYLTPPVGLNLYLASYRFSQPLATVVRNVIPFLLVQLVSVLVITYWPGMTTGLLSMFKF